MRLWVQWTSLISQKGQGEVENGRRNGSQPREGTQRGGTHRAGRTGEVLTEGEVWVGGH